MSKALEINLNLRKKKLFKLHFMYSVIAWGIKSFTFQLAPIRLNYSHQFKILFELILTFSQFLLDFLKKSFCFISRNKLHFRYLIQFHVKFNFVLRLPIEKKTVQWQSFASLRTHNVSLVRLPTHRTAF